MVPEAGSKSCLLCQVSAFILRTVGAHQRNQGVLWWSPVLFVYFLKNEMK